MTTMTLSQVIRIWINGRSPITQNIYRSNIENLDRLARELFSQSILDLDTGQLQETMRVKHTGKSAVTRNVQTWIVKGFFGTAQRLGVRKDNPAKELRAPRFEDKLADRLLTHEQVETILGATVSPRDRVLIQLLYGAGLRISEALHLRKKDLLGGGTIRVWGKGEKTAYVRIQPQLDTLLAGWGVNLTADEYLFQGYHGKPLQRTSAHAAIKRIAKQVGLPRVSAHFFRHAHATVALQNGASIVVVQKSLRHSSVTTTMRYSHVLPGDGAANYLPPVQQVDPKPKIPLAQ